MSVYKTEIKLDSDLALAAIREMPALFTPTGSRVYGGFTHESDHDFIVKEDIIWLRGEIMQGLIRSWWANGWSPEEKRTLLVGESIDYLPGEDVIVDSEKNHDVVYLTGRDPSYPKINLIFVDAKSHAAWTMATDAMVALVGKDRERCETCKDARVLAFRCLKRAFMK